MAIQKTDIKPQLIPTNAGRRTYAGPPEALQNQMVERHLIPSR